MVTCAKCGMDYEDYATYCNECDTALVDEEALENPEGSAFSWLDLIAGIATLLAVLSAIFLNGTVKRSRVNGVHKRNIASWVNLLIFSIAVGSLLIGPILTFLS